jgi:DNA polymerase beta
MKMNDNIIKWFELLIKQLEFYLDVKAEKEKLVYSFKLKSIKNALDVIKNVNFKIKKGVDLKDYHGIGKGTIDRIDEIINTGKLSEVHKADISGTHLQYVEDLMKIFGIGRVKAYELYTKYGIKSIEDLKKAVRKGSVDLPENILKGIAYVDKIKQHIPRDEMDEIYSFLIRTAIEVDNDMDIRLCGSYRREKEFPNDIDVIVSHPNIITKKQAEKSKLMRNFIETLKKKKFIVESLTSDEVLTKYMGICRLSKDYPLRRIDIRYIPQESYYTALLYFTGSGEFNQKMRSIALSMGYTLNEYRLLNEKNKPFTVRSEKDIFEYLNMEYLEPRERI